MEFVQIRKLMSAMNSMKNAGACRRRFGRQAHCWSCLWIGLLGASLSLSHIGGGEEPPLLDEDMSGYKSTPASGVIATLQQRLDRGEATLDYEPTHGYLLSLLSNLEIPVSSQLLVASKTSPNKLLISPQNPRALYFNTKANVAYVPTAKLLEIAAEDPKLGVVFYTLEQKKDAHPHLTRDNRCLECHVSSKTLNVPGLLVRSFLTMNDGDVDTLSGIMVNHRTPISKRWGGYYVTGIYPGGTHRGNVFGAEAIARHKLDPSYHANITDLRPFLDVTKYPEPGSDIVALLVLDHQVHMHNLLTRLKRDTENALRHGDSLEPAYPALEATLKYLLFVEEAPLRGPVTSPGTFRAWFEEQGPKDSHNRSLRQFDLKTRLFKYPCSYMIYSPSFAALPVRALRHLYHRLWEILSGQDTSPGYQSLSAESRRAIREILVATIPDLPAYWRL